MTVAELIEKLRRFPPDWPVRMDSGSAYLPVGEVEKAHYSEDEVLIWPGKDQ